MAIDLTEFERGDPFAGDFDVMLSALQDNLARQQISQMVHRRRALVLFEGWTGSGKKAALRRLVGSWDPSHVRVINVGGAAEADDDRHWLAPFWSRLPAAGDTTVFYRSWYRRVIEEMVSGKIDEKRFARACDEINEFEAQQRDHGTLVVKLFFHVSAERQAVTLRERQQDSWQRHLLADETVVGVGQRERVVDVLHELFRQTDTRWAPWRVIDGDNPEAGCIASLSAISEMFEKAMPAEPPADGDTVVQFPSMKVR